MKLSPFERRELRQAQRTCKALRTHVRRALLNRECFGRPAVELRTALGLVDLLRAELAQARERDRQPQPESTVNGEG